MFKFVTINTHHSTYCENAGREGNHPGLMWSERQAAAETLLADICTNADAVALQEVRAHNRDAVVSAVKKAMGGDQLFVAEHEYGRRFNDADGTRDLLVLVVRGTKDDYARHTLSDGTNTVLGLYNRHTQVLVATTHFPLPTQHRLEFANRIGAWLAGFECKRVVLGGDMNAFPDAQGHEQVQSILSQAGMMDATQFLHHRSDGRRATTTFVPYPFDKVPELDDPDKLDYVLTRGMLLVDAAAVDDMPQCYTFEGRSYGPTDHLPLVVRLKII